MMSELHEAERIVLEPGQHGGPDSELSIWAREIVERSEVAVSGDGRERNYQFYQTSRVLPELSTAEGGTVA